MAIDIVKIAALEYVETIPDSGLIVIGDTDSGKKPVTIKKADLTKYIQQIAEDVFKTMPMPSPVLHTDSIYIEDCEGANDYRYISFGKTLETDNYIVLGSIQTKEQYQWQDDNSVLWTIRKPTATGFTLNLHEVDSVPQQISFKYAILKMQ